MRDEFYFDAVGETLDAERARADAAEQLNRDYAGAQKETQRLTHEIDVALHGQEAARQASLCDLVSSAIKLRERADAALVLAGQALAQNAALIHAAAECAVMRDRAIRERNATQESLEARWHDVPDIRTIDAIKSIDLSLFPALPPNPEKLTYSISDSVLIDVDGEYQVANFIRHDRSSARFKWSHDGTMMGNSVTRWCSILDPHKPNEVSDAS